MVMENENINVLATAKVLVTLEVDAGSHWGGDCATQQVFDQAGRETIQRVMNELRKLGPRVRVVGDPKVTMVVVGKKE